MVKTYYICFTQGFYWLYHFMKKGFGHIVILEQLTKNDYFFIHPSFNYLTISLCYTENFTQFYEKYTVGAIVKVTLDLQRQKRENILFYSPFNFINCVSLTKYLLGIHNPFIQTPYQLYKYLIKLNNHFYIKDVSIYYS